MLTMKTYHVMAGTLAVAGVLAWGGLPLHAGNPRADQGNGNGGDGRIKTVFVIAMENHNWTQPIPNPDPTQFPNQLFNNPAAPFLNSLVNGTSGISDQVAYATNYLNAGVGVHPSEPNYIWAEAGTNFGVFNDDDPYNKTTCQPDTVQTTHDHLSAYLQKTGRTWRSYQEDVNVDLGTNTPLPSVAWTAPIFSASGSFNVGVTNSYYYQRQFNYAAKHNPMIFFTDTNGGQCPGALSTFYPPLQQLAIDLQNDSVADYNWITPNQFNDQHSKLSLGYGIYGATSDQNGVAAGDNFLARVLPLIMASKAYQDHGLIVLWWDESEPDKSGDSKDDGAHTLPFFVISKDVHENVGGKPFSTAVALSHSAFLRTMQEIFHVDPRTGFPFLGDAVVANDLSSLFRPGVIH